MSEVKKTMAEKLGSNPASDSWLLALKTIATRGGDRGPLYDQGVLDVIDQIEKHGFFTHNKMVGLLSLLALPIDPRILTEDEIKEADRFLHDRGWSREQGGEYARGVFDTEGILPLYKKT